MSNRIKVDDNGRQYFDGLEGTMTADEAMQLTARREMVPVANALVDAVTSKMVNLIISEPSISGALIRLAKSKMDRRGDIDPDDDEVYEYEQRVYDLIVGTMVRGMTEELRKAHLR